MPDPQKTAQDKVRDKLKIIAAKTNGAETANAENQSVRLLIHPESTVPGIFRATLMIDQNKNLGNYSIKDISAAIIAVANSSGFSKVNCSLKQISCFQKNGARLSLESTDSPEIIRLEIAKDKTTSEKVADIAIQIFFEGLLQHLHQLHDNPQ
jgi:hypothetical protein